MLVELDRLSLVIFMGINLEEAVRDLPSEGAADLYDRFLAWTNVPLLHKRALPK